VASWKDFCRHWAERGITHIRTQPFMPIGRGRYQPELAPSDEQYLRFHMDTRELADELRGCFVDWGDPLEHIFFWTRTGAPPWSHGIQTDGWYELSCYVPVLVGSALDHPLEELWQLDLKSLWQAPIMRRFAERLMSMRGMSELELEIYREESLHLDLFDEEQLDLFFSTDDLGVLRQQSERNLKDHFERWSR
jgi:MoaA/NifB/PqqE/SkfB family radical SAM enzyme